MTQQDRSLPPVHVDPNRQPSTPVDEHRPPRGAPSEGRTREAHPTVRFALVSPRDGPDGRGLGRVSWVVDTVGHVRDVMVLRTGRFHGPGEPRASFASFRLVDRRSRGSEGEVGWGNLRSFLRHVIAGSSKAHGSETVKPRFGDRGTSPRNKRCHRLTDGMATFPSEQEFSNEGHRGGSTFQFTRWNLWNLPHAMNQSRMNAPGHRRRDEDGHSDLCSGGTVKM